MSNRGEALRLVTPGEHDAHEMELVARDTARATVYALLDVADAIREQTEALTGDSKGVILIERNQ